MNAATVCLRLVIFGNGTAPLYTYRGGERDEDLGILLRAPTSRNIIFIFSKSSQIKIHHKASMVGDFRAEIKNFKVIISST